MQQTATRTQNVRLYRTPRTANSRLHSSRSIRINELPSGFREMRYILDGKRARPARRQQTRIHERAGERTLFLHASELKVRELRAVQSRLHFGGHVGGRDSGHVVGPPARSQYLVPIVPSRLNGQDDEVGGARVKRELGHQEPGRCSRLVRRVLLVAPSHRHVSAPRQVRLRRRLRGCSGHRAVCVDVAAAGIRHQAHEKSQPALRRR